MKTAYVELNTTNQICSICNSKGKPYFRYKGITMFPDANVTSLSEILHKDFQYFILDMGVLNTYNSQEFFRCDKAFLICSKSKWRYSQIKEKAKQLLNNLPYQHCSVIVNLCEKESNPSSFVNSCEHLPFPFVENPFQLETRNFRAIYRILKL